MKYLLLNQKSSGKYRRGVINNRPHLFTEVVALEAPSVMNRILYPAELVFNAVKDLISKPAPAKHPVVNGEHISAQHPLAVNAHNIGGFISNARKDGSRVIAELALDIEVASKDKRGVETMRRIENGERIGFSTGLPLAADEAKGIYDGEEYDLVMNSITWDHLAILLDEEPAGKNTYSIVNCAVNGDSDNMTKINQTNGSNIMDLEQLITALIANSRNTFKSGDKAKLLKMEPLDLAELITNSQIKEKAKELTTEDAKKMLERDGFVVNSKDQFDLFEINREGFEAYMADKKDARDSLIGELVTNSKLTKDALESMSDDVLNGIKQSIVPQQDFSARGNQIVNERQPVSADDDFADYPH